MGIADKLSAFIVETKYHNIPEDTVKFVNNLGLKTMGGILAGSISVTGRKFLRYMLRYDRRPEAGVYGCGFSTSVENAVLINAYFAHGSELEDNYYPGCTSDLTIVPVVFPLGEWLKLTGEEIIEASFVGYEVQARLGTYTYPRTEEMGIEANPYFGTFGAVAAASKSLGLDLKETRNALGLVLIRAGGYIMNHGTDAHYLDTAWASMNGVNAALLAKEGITGPSDMEGWLTGVMGKENIKINEIGEGLGKPPYFIHSIWYKKYPCCFETHRQIDSLSNLMRKNKLAAPDITKVVVHCGPVDGSCDRPEPESVEDCKFSFQHVLAALMLEGDVGTESFTVGKLKDQRFVDARKRVKVIIHRDWPMTEMSGVGSVEVTVKDGRVLNEGMVQPLGGPQLPLTREQVVALFKKYALPVLSDRQAEVVKGMALNLEKMQDISPLTHILTYCLELQARSATS